MNLINCNENCIYQEEGNCKLTGNAIINSVSVNGCSYFTEKKFIKNPYRKNQYNYYKNK